MAFPSSAWKSGTWTGGSSRCARRARSSGPALRWASTWTPRNCGGAMTRWWSRPAPRCRASCRCPAGSWPGSTRRWSTCPRPTVPVRGTRPPARRAAWQAVRPAVRRSARTACRWSSSAAATPPRTAWARRCGRAPPRSSSWTSTRCPARTGPQASRGRCTRSPSVSPPLTRRPARSLGSPARTGTAGSARSPGPTVTFACSPRSPSASLRAPAAGSGRCGWPGRN